jgi:hypothetical protein
MASNGPSMPSLTPRHHSRLSAHTSGRGSLSGVPARSDRRILLIASGSILGLLVLLGSCVASLERRTRLTV